MVRRFLPLLLTAALIACAAPRVLVDNGGYSQLTHVKNAGRFALGEEVDDTGDEQSALSLRAALESKVERVPVIDLFPVFGSLKERQASGYALQIYALNCKIII